MHGHFRVEVPYLQWNFSKSIHERSKRLILLLPNVDQGNWSQTRLGWDRRNIILHALFLPNDCIFNAQYPQLFFISLFHLVHLFLHVPHHLQGIHQPFFWSILHNNVARHILYGHHVSLKMFAQSHGGCQIFRCIRSISHFIHNGRQKSWFRVVSSCMFPLITDTCQISFNTKVSSNLNARIIII